MDNTFFPLEFIYDPLAIIDFDHYLFYNYNYQLFVTIDCITGESQAFELCKN